MTFAHWKRVSTSATNNSQGDASRTEVFDIVKTKIEWNNSLQFDYSLLFFGGGRVGVGGVDVPSEGFPRYDFVHGITRMTYL